MADLLQNAAFFLGACQPLGVRSAARPEKHLQSPGRDIEFPTTMVKYSPLFIMQNSKYLKIKCFINEKDRKSPTFALCQNHAAVRRRLGASKIHA
jgi:hypothetical protein